MISIFPTLNKFLFRSLCLALFFVPAVVSAQDSVSFSVSPTIFDMTATPGQTWRSSIRVINANPFELRVYVDLANFVPQGEGGTPRFIPISPETSDQSTFAEWITTEKEVLIPPEQTIELPITISVPDTAAPGGHFAAVLISTKPPQNQLGKTKVETSQVITSLVFLRVAGDVSESSSIRSFRSTDYFLSRPEATFDLRIENKGNVHVQPQGEIKIFNMWGQERGIIPVNQQTLFGNVLPNSVRKYSFSWSGEWSMSDIGRYKAIATLAYGIDTRQFMTSETNFWIVPWKIILVFLTIIGGFIALISWAIKLYVRKMLMMAGVSPGQVPTQSASAPKTRKQISVVAPIEAGILDLRSRFTEGSSVKESVTTSMEFVRAYWIFFVVLVSAIGFISGVVWFVRGAATPARDYEVTIEDEGRTIKVSSENEVPVMAEPTVATTTPDTSAATSSLPTIAIINRSGNEAAVDVAEKTLIDNGYIIDSSENDLGSLDEKTVIVYSPAFSEQALSLSMLLNNALLSAFFDEDTETDVTIYLGTDAILAE